MGSVDVAICRAARLIGRCRVAPRAPVRRRSRVTPRPLSPFRDLHWQAARIAVTAPAPLTVRRSASPRERRNSAQIAGYAAPSLAIPGFTVAGGSNRGYGARAAHGSAIRIAARQPECGANRGLRSALSRNSTIYTGRRLESRLRRPRRSRFGDPHRHAAAIAKSAQPDRANQQFAPRSRPRARHSRCRSAAPAYSRCRSAARRPFSPRSRARRSRRAPPSRPHAAATSYFRRRCRRGDSGSGV
jgi:hypothetical protein